MGFVVSKVSRHVKRFNVENRAHRMLDRDKLPVAPRHSTTLKYMNEPSAEVKEELEKKHEALDEHLKKVYVVSHDPPPIKYGKPSDKARLPLDRRSHEDGVLGYTEPESLPVGRLSLKQAMQLIKDTGENPDTGPEAVAKQYNLTVDDAENILRYFGSFKVFIPESKGKLKVVPDDGRTISATEIKGTKKIDKQ